IVAGVSIWAMSRRKDSAEDYFLAGRHLGWFIVGASIFASNIGSEHLVGLAGSGATDGVALAPYELHGWCLLVVGWVVVSVDIRFQHRIGAPCGACRIGSDRRCCAGAL